MTITTIKDELTRIVRDPDFVPTKHKRTLIRKVREHLESSRALLDLLKTGCDENIAQCADEIQAMERLLLLHMMTQVDYR